MVVGADWLKETAATVAVVHSRQSPVLPLVGAAPQV
jgi:hypothetical protein